MDPRDPVRALDVESIGCDQEVVVRDDSDEPAQRALPRLRDPRFDEERTELIRRHVVADEKQPDQHREPVGLGSEPAAVHLEIDMREDRLAGRVQAPRDPDARVSRSRELLPQSCRDAGRRREGRRLQILTFFNVSQPACTGASRDPSAFCGL